MISACGVLCSNCPAYYAKEKGVAHQKRTVEAWRRIYGLDESVEHVSCHGYLGPDEKVFHACCACKARRCSQFKRLGSCAECPIEPCVDLEKAQSVWDGVPNLINTLSSSDFDIYARPYCGHRERLADLRVTFFNRK